MRFSHRKTCAAYAIFFTCNYVNETFFNAWNLECHCRNHIPKDGVRMTMNRLVTYVIERLLYTTVYTINILFYIKFSIKNCNLKWRSKWFNGNSKAIKKIFVWKSPHLLSLLKMMIALNSGQTKRSSNNNKRSMESFSTDWPPSLFRALAFFKKLRTKNQI